jgi:hypothetical protein
MTCFFCKKYSYTSRLNKKGILINYCIDCYNNKEPFILKNFISKDDCDIVISFINKNENNFDKNGCLISKRIGIGYRSDLVMIDSNDVSSIKDTLLKYGKEFLNYCNKLYDVKNDLYINQIWLVKTLFGGSQTEHSDDDNGYDSQMKYSGIVYLNDIKNSGYLYFKDLNFKYYPKAGDLVIFRSDLGKHGVSTTFQDRYTMPMWATDDYSFSIENF